MLLQTHHALSQTADDGAKTSKTSNQYWVKKGPSPILLAHLQGTASKCGPERTPRGFMSAGVAQSILSIWLSLHHTPTETGNLSQGSRIALRGAWTAVVS
jgi:hypothetical protein